MRSKGYLSAVIAVAALASAGGCANAQRFLPGGIVKVRDLEKGRPVSPDLAEEVSDRERRARKAAFPILSAQPSTPPQPEGALVRRNKERALLDRRDALERRLEEDRAKAAAERVDGVPEASAQEAADAQGGT